MQGSVIQRGEAENRTRELQIGPFLFLSRIGANVRWPEPCRKNS